MASPSVLWCPPRDLGADVAEDLLARHGTLPVAVGRAPGRVNLMGDHTDYLGGHCLPLPLPHDTWVAWAPRTDGRRVLSSAGHEATVVAAGAGASGWPAYVIGVLDALGHTGGLSLHVASSVPIGAGLSSSAALICAVAVAVSGAAPDDLLLPCIAAEQEGVGAPTGGLDQAVALLAAPDHALLLDFATSPPAWRHVPWLPEVDGVELLVIDTGTRHAHATGGYGERRREGERACQEGEPTDPVLRRRRQHVITEDLRVGAVVTAMVRRDWAEVGRIFTVSHTSLRDDYDVSCPELDLTVDAALGGGALGARMTGGGFGGCALVLARVEDRERVLTAIGRAYERQGWQPPRALATSGGRPAGRVPLT